jgi:hypothetical protein
VIARQEGAKRTRTFLLPFWLCLAITVLFAAALGVIAGAWPIYRRIAAAMRMATAGVTADPALAIATLSPLVEAAFVVAAMVIGLVVGARFAELSRLSRRQGEPLSTCPPQELQLRWVPSVAGFPLVHRGYG